MKITPLEIKQKEFEKKLRGYDKDEVNAFLSSLANEWERVLEENKELSIHLKQAKKELEKLREVEDSLYKTLKTAEKTGENVIGQANKAAELHMRETKINAEALLNESKSKARAMIEKAEVESRRIIDDLNLEIQKIQNSHRELEAKRENVISELKNLSIGLVEKVEQTVRDEKEIQFEEYAKKAKKLSQESEEQIAREKEVLRVKVKEAETPNTPNPEPAKSEVTIKNKESAKEKDSPASEQKSKGHKISRTVSFFDDLDTE